ncbi:MAG: 50S ribosomal protein L17 [Bacteroidetes bacterium]|nr:MAG: 50S ribosomal protein L17 [Bacteroidota bacterium]
MRHKKSFNHLGRTSSHRKAMLANMASSLIMHKRITTTLAKAKALRGYVEPLITKAKNDTTHSRRMVFKQLTDKYAVTELFREVSAKVGDRPGGYTRIIKLENRLGDNAEMAMIELVDYNENLLTEKTTKKTKTRRRRGGSKKTAATTDTTEKVTTTETAEVKDEAKEEVKEEIKEKKVAEEPKAEATEGAKEEEAKEDDKKEEGKE